VLPWACLPGRHLGPLHSVLPRIWPYLEKRLIFAWPIILLHDYILTTSNKFLHTSINCGTLQMRIAVSRGEIAQRYRELLRTRE
jgi:hypothetical protein